jgi:EAL domain-containing protein (putative c-di-GMP-specific phosphodiesterase class I)
MDEEDVIPGQQWRPKIEKAIHESDFFLACLSENSISKRGFLQREIKKALDVWQEKLPDDIYLIPVLLEKCKVPESLADFQWVEIHEQGGWSKLLKAIRIRTNNDYMQIKPAVYHSEKPMHSSLRTNTSSTSETTATKNQEPIHADKSLDNVKGMNKLPLVVFPEEMTNYLKDAAPEYWKSLDEGTKEFIVTLGTKLEPIVQVSPPTPIPLVRGFENLALGSLGENFSQICALVPKLDPGILRLLLTLAALKTTSMLRENAAQDRNTGVWTLLFTINLDPEMLDCYHLDKFLDWFQHYRSNNIIFEVNEKTTINYLKRLKILQSDFKLRFCADDFNDWDQDVKKALCKRVEMSKVDYKTFVAAMDVRGDCPNEAIRRIAAHRIPGKPLIVEGIENPNYLRFLQEHWPSDKYGHLFGQGYIVEPGHPWDTWTTDLRTFGLPGGHFLASPVNTSKHAHH